MTELELHNEATIAAWEPYTEDHRIINGHVYALERWLFTWSVSRLCGYNRLGRYCFQDKCSAQAFFDHWDGCELPVVGEEGCTAIK